MHTLLTPVTLALENCPASQRVQVASPLVLFVPSGHVAHALVPYSSAYWPCGQLVVEHVPSDAAYCPGTTSTHLLAPMVIALPQTELGQAAHQSLPPAAMSPSLPAGQLVHVSDPVLEILPQSHVVHVVDAAAL